MTRLQTSSRVATVKIISILTSHQEDRSILNNVFVAQTMLLWVPSKEWTGISKFLKEKDGIKISMIKSTNTRNLKVKKFEELTTECLK